MILTILCKHNELLILTIWQTLTLFIHLIFNASSFFVLGFNTSSRKKCHSNLDKRQTQSKLEFKSKFVGHLWHTDRKGHKWQAISDSGNASLKPRVSPRAEERNMRTQNPKCLSKSKPFTDKSSECLSSERFNV